MTAYGVVAQEFELAKPPPPDSPLPSFSDVVFQCNFDGTQGQQSAVDESHYHNPIVFRTYVNPGAYISTTYPKFGTGALYTIGGWVTVTSDVFEPLGDGDFTVETFIRPDALTAGGGIIELPFMKVVIGVATCSLYWYDDTYFPGGAFPGYNVPFGQLGTPASGPTVYGYRHNLAGGYWVHFAVCRFQGQLRIFFDGVTYAQTIWNAKGNHSLGYGLGIGALYQNGGLSAMMWDAFRVTNGAWYRTDSFTPPSAPFFPSVLPPLFSDEVIYPPLVLEPGHITPDLLVDSDSFPAPSVDLQNRTILPPLMLRSTGAISPSYVNAGSLSEQLYNSNFLGRQIVSSPFPTGTIAGRLLISVIMAYPNPTYFVNETIDGVPTQGSTTWGPNQTFNFHLNGGWTYGGSQQNPNVALSVNFFGGSDPSSNINVLMTSAFAWRVLDGSLDDQACEWTWDGDGEVFYSCQTFQFKDADFSDPIGAVRFISDKSTSILAPAMATRLPNSLIFASVQTNNANPQFSVPTNWTLRNGGTGNSFAQWTEGVPVTPSDPISSTMFFRVPWTLNEIEIDGTNGADDVFGAATIFRDPIFVNSDTVTGTTGATSGAPALPGSRVAGNLLIAFIQLGLGSQSISVSSGWTIADTSTNANSSSAWAWRIIDGSEAPPTFSWQSSTWWHSQIYQFSNAHPTSPIGAFANNLGASATLSINGITTTHDLSMVFGIMLTQGNQVIPLPTNYTNIAQYNDSFGSDRAAFEYKHPAGTLSDGISVSISNLNWHAFLIEIRSLGDAVKPSLVVDTDTFYAPHTNLMPGLVIDSDAFYTPDLENNGPHTVSRRLTFLGPDGRPLYRKP